MKIKTQEERIQSMLQGVTAAITAALEPFVKEMVADAARKDLHPDLQEALSVMAAAAKEARIPLDKRLWDIDDVAEYFKQSKYTTQQRVIKQPGFPQTVSMVSDRWFAGDVIDWAKKSRGRKPVNFR